DRGKRRGTVWVLSSCLSGEAFDNFRRSRCRIDRSFARAPHATTVGDELACIADRGIEQVAFEYLVEKAERSSLRRIDRACRQNQLEGLLDANESRHALSAACAWDDSECYFGQAEPRAGRCHAIVAGERDLEPASEDRAVHGRNYRDVQVLERIEQAAILCLTRRSGELADVSTREERAALASEHYRLRAAPRGDLLQRSREIRADFGRDGVDWWVVRQQYGDLTIALRGDGSVLFQRSTPNYVNTDCDCIAALIGSRSCPAVREQVTDGCPCNLLGLCGCD